jgi:hypothetical protein
MINIIAVVVCTISGVYCSYEKSWTCTSLNVIMTIVNLPYAISYLEGKL